MLSRFDDYPIHQTPDPLPHPATSDRNFYDRYWLNGYDRDAEFYFAVGMGLYPHRGILDAAFSVVHRGEQHAFHASRRAPAERGETQVGPLRIEVVEPMRRLRLVIEPNETGIECDLLFQARSACVQEGRQTLLSGSRPVMDATRFTQWGHWSGEIGYAGEKVDVRSERVLGTKDRSWGLRPVGERETGGAPATEAPGIFFLWAPLHWDDCCSHFALFEHADGERWHQSGAIVPAYASLDSIPGVEDPATQRIANLDYQIRYAPGERRAEWAKIGLVASDGARHEIELEPLLCFRMKALGYLHPEWAQGVWKGELAVAGESWKCDDVAPLALENLHIQQVMRAHWGDRVGMGVLEQLAVGPHAPSGFTEFLDGGK
jgi:hypothetical protein